MAPPSHGNTKGYQIYIHHVHIADGFADDCEELIHRWLKTETLTYETFCEIWKDMQFNFLYHGRASGAEMAELSEELLQIAKHYMVSNTDNFEETVAGLFLVYALLHLQPYGGFASLRLVPADAPALARMEACARRTRRYDVLYILASILIEGPVQYHAANRERGMESSIRKYLEGTTGIDRLGIRPKGVFYRQNEESDLLRELNSITKRYSDAKKAIGGENLGLNYTNEKLATELDSSLKEIINGIIDDSPEATQKMQDHYSKVQAIKEKAMRQAVDGVKYLATVADKPSCSPKPNTEACFLKKRKQSTPKKSPAKRSPRKRRRRDSTSDTSDSDDDLSLSSDDMSPTSDDDVATRRLEIAPDLNMDEFDKEKDLRPAKGERESEINIQIDSLPVFIRTEEGGKSYQIEVIDKSSGEKREDAQSRFKLLTDVSIERLESPGEGTSSEGIPSASSPGPSGSTLGNAPAEGTSESGTEVSKTDADEEDSKSKLRKPEKRELKKTAIMWKFQRMGMLPMANFNDNNRKWTRNRSQKK